MRRSAGWLPCTTHASGSIPGAPATDAALTALAVEAVEALLAEDRAQDAEQVLAGLSRQQRQRGRCRLLRARVLLAQGDTAGARALFEAGFEVEDLREGEEALSETWAALTSDPLPARYDFRMRP